MGKGEAAFNFDLGGVVLESCGFGLSCPSQWVCVVTGSGPGPFLCGVGHCSLGKEGLYGAHQLERGRAIELPLFAQQGLPSFCYKDLFLFCLLEL